ncbi:MAG TPA: VCBS repeat-containing protein, partial [Methanosarcinales archaeon]|nr:VCBS repeat-containing protein [Methanosarcinales archaeon]
MKTGIHAGTVVVVMLLILAMLAGYAQARTMIDPTIGIGMTGVTGPNIFGDWRSDRIDPDMTVTHPERFEMEATSSESPFMYGITAGDLNEDGKDDVLVFNGTYNSTGFMSGAYTYEYVSAVNGHDGTELWRQNIVYETAGAMFGDPPAYPLGDLNGDGTDDVLVIT